MHGFARSAGISFGNPLHRLGIALKCAEIVTASGQQGARPDCAFTSGSASFQEFQQSGHGNESVSPAAGDAACLRAGAFLFSIEPFLKFPPFGFYTRTAEMLAVFTSISAVAMAYGA